ncbi:MAG: hypothetical protein IPO92_11685 [Saprospiraceae bacterium]|nr:hypothetical protein [Saprospiraceae bacterium]
MKNQDNVDNVIGFSNYDIGHVFSTGGGGIAELRSPCSIGKARGVTGSPTPIGDAFDIDYVAHEMGHQFGADHTQNNDCQRNENSYGTWQWKYHKWDTPEFVTLISKTIVMIIFIGISLSEIANFVVAGSGNTCAVKTDGDNQNQLSVYQKQLHRFQYRLHLVRRNCGSDAQDGDLLSYCWEQIDNETATMPPKSTNTGGPAFRSLSPMSSPVRYFPDLQRRYMLTWEALPKFH